MSYAPRHICFLKLAGRFTKASTVETRWREMLEAEASILAAQPPGPRIHSGYTITETV